MRCAACGRPGGVGPDRNEFGRQQCRFCLAEVARPCDRVLYLACECRIAWDWDDRRKAHRLGDGWSARGFLAAADAYAYLERRRGGGEWAPITVAGHAGLYRHDRGDAWFQFVQEQLVDTRPLGGER